ncbi:acyltransferase family protein [Lachnospiraceae bacterium 62-35]
MIQIPLGGGYLGVDFFFVLSGYFLCYSCFQKKFTPISFLERRILKLYPLYFIGLMLVFVYSCSSIILSFGIGIKSAAIIWNYLLNTIDEILMIQMAGFTRDWTNFMLWYVSVLIIDGYILYYLLYVHKDFTIKFISPILILIGYSLIFQFGGDKGLDYNVNYIYFMTGGMWRGLAGMCLGTLIYSTDRYFDYIAGRIRNRWFDIMYSICIGIFVSVIFMMKHSVLDFIFPIAVAGVIICSKHNTKIGIIFNCLGRLSDCFLGKNISYIMYVISKFVINVFHRAWPYKDYCTLAYLIFWIILVITAVLLDTVMPYILKKVGIIFYEYKSI